MRAVRRVEGHALELLPDGALEPERADPGRGDRAGAGRPLADVVAIDDQHVGAARGERAGGGQAGEGGAADEHVGAAAAPQGRPLRAPQGRALRHGRTALEGRHRDAPAGRRRPPAEHVVVDRLDLVEHERVGRAGDADAGADPDGGGVDRGRAAVEEAAGARHAGGDGLPHGGAVVQARAEAGEVDAAELCVLAHVAQEVRQLEGLAEPAERHVLGLGHAEQRGHHPPDRARRAVHVGVELVPAVHLHGRAVDAHRVHVVVQLLERQPVAAAGVDERGRTGWRGAASCASHASSAARRTSGEVGAARPVDDLVGGADVGVQRVRRGPDRGGQAPRGPVVRRVVATVHAPARVVAAP